ncbi:EexN family lipoprotein [Acinetobacter sp. ULE_I064]|uniref:EexN family lipoprotein n=1 Tax=Acinetobacter sp. ULE_I064 TaxID=3373071 RepID=UPI003AF449E1
MKRLAIIMLSTLIVACSSKEQAKSIDYYFENISEAKDVIKDCRSRVKTASEYQKIMGEENCANAELAQQRWNKQQNSSSGKTATKTAPIRFN